MSGFCGVAEKNWLKNKTANIENWELWIFRENSKNKQIHNKTENS